MSSRRKIYEKLDKGPYVKPHPEFHEVEVIEYPEVEKPYPNIVLKPFRGKQEKERWTRHE